MLSLYTNEMGSFFDVVWGVLSVTKTIRVVSYLSMRIYEAKPLHPLKVRFGFIIGNGRKEKVIKYSVTIPMLCVMLDLKK